MRIGNHETDDHVLVVAEIGNNHEGSVELAAEMVKAASAAGAGAVKFQTFHTEHYVSRRDEARFQRLRDFELTCDQFRELADLARREGLLFLSTPFDCRSASFLGRIADAIKISSSDNTFYPLVEAAAETTRPLIMSTGLADLATIRQAVVLIRNVWQERVASPELALLHCVTSYPVPAAEVNLAYIGRIKRQFPECTIGYSDHAIGIEASVLAVAAGARIVEKHFTIDKDYSDFRDHQLSADPSELAELVGRIRTVEELLGDGEDSQPGEREVEFLLRRSIVASRDLKTGNTIDSADITWVRPAGGLTPGQEHRVVGKTLKQDVVAGDLLTEDLVTG